MLLGCKTCKYFLSSIHCSQNTSSNLNTSPLYQVEAVQFTQFVIVIICDNQLTDFQKRGRCQCVCIFSNIRCFVQIYRYIVQASTIRYIDMNIPTSNVFACKVTKFSMCLFCLHRHRYVNWLHNRLTETLRQSFVSEFSNRWSLFVFIIEVASANEGKNAHRLYHYRK